jgi:hypothetical protein
MLVCEYPYLACRVTLSVIAILVVMSVFVHVTRPDTPPPFVCPPGQWVHGDAFGMCVHGDTLTLSGTVNSGIYIRDTVGPTIIADADSFAHVRHGKTV